MSHQDTQAEIMFEKWMDFFDKVFDKIPEDSAWAWLVVFPIGIALMAFFLMFDRCRYVFSGMELST